MRHLHKANLDHLNCQRLYNNKTVRKIYIYTYACDADKYPFNINPYKFICILSHMILILHGRDHANI